MTVAGQNVVIRELQTFEELASVQAVEKEVWSMAGDDAMPLTLAIACKAAGNLFLGAFDGVKMVGFAFGFFGREHERVILHSHMVGVLAPYQHLNLGYRLKLAQREWALARQVGEITWTYDPLQSRNAHFNFAKLGIVSDTYKVDFYGPETSSILHRNGTDRLWGRWVLNARRVRERIAGKDKRAETLDALRLLAPMVRFNGTGQPVRSDFSEALGRQRIAIEIPGDIMQVERNDAGLAREWREATRWAFSEAIKAGFFVAEYCRMIRGQQGPGAYLLERGDLQAAVSEM